MKNWKLFCSICLTASLLFACGNPTEKNSEEPKKTEAFTTEKPSSNDSSKNTSSNKQNEETTSITGQKMTDVEQQKLSDFIAKYPVEYARTIETGDFTPLANEYIMHDTKLYENLLKEIDEKHKAQTTEEVNKLTISNINRKSDTDFTVDTKEIIEETKNGKKNTIERHRQYSLYYDYVEGDVDNSFFKISDIKELNE